MTFDKHSIPELKAIAKQYGLKGYSGLSKGPLVKLVKKHLKKTKSGIEVKGGVAISPGPIQKSGGAVPARPTLKRQTNNPVQDAREHIRRTLDFIKGGQLPSRITDKMKKLDIEGGGHRLFHGKAGKTIHHVGGILSGSHSTGSKYGDIGVAAGQTLSGSSEGETTSEQSQRLAETYACNTTKDPKVKKACNKKAATSGGKIKGGDLCDDQPECRTKELSKGACAKESKKFLRTSPSDASEYTAMLGKFNKCIKEEREKMNCPPKCTEGKKQTGIMRLLSKVSDKLLKGTNKVVAGLIVAGQPAFMTACGAAGTAMGGPPGGALSAAACGALWKKMMVDDAGSDVYVKKELNDNEISVLNMMGKMGSSAGKKAAGGNVVSGPGGSPSPGGMGVSNKIDWEDMNWGSFTEQLQQYNRTHKKNLTLKELAEHVVADPSKFKEKTKKRARFYLNVILKKK
jgi:hypothetical protein